MSSRVRLALGSNPALSLLTAPWGELPHLFGPNFPYGQDTVVRTLNM